MDKITFKVHVVGYEVRNVTAKNGKNYTFKTALCTLAGAAVRFESDIDMTDKRDKDCLIECSVSADRYLRPQFKVVSVK